MSSQLQDEQRDLVRRVHRVVHWLKHAFGYTGSKQTADFGGIIFAKLAHNQTTGPLLASDPNKLRGVVKTVASRTLIDEMRKRAATGGFVTSPHPGPELPEREQWTPSIHRQTSDRQRTEMVHDELRRFLAGEGSEKIQPAGHPRAPRRSAPRSGQGQGQGQGHVQPGETLSPWPSVPCRRT